MAVVAALLLCGCAGVDTPFGDRRSLVRAEVALVETTPVDGQIVAGVRAALAEQGVPIAATGKQLLEIGWTRRAAGLDDGSMTSTRPGKRRLRLCRGSVNVLALALVDRFTGAVVARGGAAADRCRPLDATRIARLTRTAVEQIYMTGHSITKQAPAGSTGS